MPIFLRAPEYKPGGPDGQGWNRLSLGAHYGRNSDQCALLPRSHGTLWESWDTRRAQWGGFGPCIRGGACGNCPILAAQSPTSLDVADDRVAVYVVENGTPIPEVHIMGTPWAWSDLARLKGWRLGRRFHNEQGPGFWLHREVTDDAL